MGRRHAQKVMALADAGHPVKLIGVVDIVAQRAADLGKRLSVRHSENARELLAQADAAVVAVSTLGHYDVVKHALLAGCDVLVEKPMAATMAEGEELVEIAQRAGRILQVGHLEWFNNVMRSIRDQIRNPRFIEAHRMGAFSRRATDIDVVRDLMIHDIEILQRIVGAEPSRIESVGISVLSDKVDIANARLTFPNGCVANLTASRVSLAPMRRLRFFQGDGCFLIDFLEHAAAVIRLEVPHDAASPELQIEKIEVERGDALLDQLLQFVDAVRTGSKPAVDGVEGLAALRTAIRVLDGLPTQGVDFDFDPATEIKAGPPPLYPPKFASNRQS